MAAVNNDIQFVFICPYEGGFHKLRENVYLPKEGEVYHCAGCGGKVKFVRNTYYSLSAIRYAHRRFQSVKNDERRSPEKQY